LISPTSRSCSCTGTPATVRKPARPQWPSIGLGSAERIGIMRVLASAATWPHRHSWVRRQASSCDLGRQAVGGQHQVVLVALVGPADGHRVRMGHGAQLAREAVAQFLQAAGPGDEGGGLVERGQALVLLLQALGLLAHLGLQVLIEALQRLRHLVEAGREVAEFVGGAHLHPGHKVARRCG
jgi:hypothetical protein